MKWILVSAALFGASSVIIGAASSHIAGLSDTPEILLTGLRYHQIHSVVLLALGLYALSQKPQRSLTISALLFCTGIVLFSGSLYLSSLSWLAWLTFLTPFGGLCFIAAWLSLLFLKKTT